MLGCATAYIPFVFPHAHKQPPLTPHNNIPPSPTHPGSSGVMPLIFTNDTHAMVRHVPYVRLLMKPYDTNAAAPRPASFCLSAADPPKNDWVRARNGCESVFGGAVR